MLADLLIVGLTLTAAWRGARRGLLRSLAGLGGSIAGILVAIITYRSTGSAGAALAALVFVTAGAHTLAHLATRGIRRSMLGRVNAVGGAALGAAWALTWLALAIIALRVAPMENEMTRAVHASQFADAVVRAEARIAARDGLGRLFEEILGGPAAATLRASVDFRPLAAAEGELLELANAARARRGVPPLQWDGALAAVGRSYVADLYRRGAFTHEGRDGSTPGERLTAHRIRFTRAGENLALAPTVSLAHARLMSSPTHRAHLLDRGFTRIGIGAVYGDQGVLVAQEFAA